jgi:ferredoxin
MDVPCAVQPGHSAGHRISVLGSDRVLRCGRGQDVLNAAIKAGIERLPVGCRGGGCGVCRVLVHSGPYETGRMSKRHVTSDEASLGFALACRLYPVGDLVIEFAPVRSTA